jgi:diguanylate cyclase (GGDEF)-like protein
VVGRIGGDEFAVIFWDEPTSIDQRPRQERRSSAGEHPREVIAIAKRFRRQINTAELNLLGPSGNGELTISGGLATLGPDGDTVERLFEQADGALMEAKKRGKNRIYLVGGPPNDIDKIG